MKYATLLLAATFIFPLVVVYGASLRYTQFILRQLNVGLPWSEKAATLVVVMGAMLHILVTGVIIMHWMGSREKKKGDE